MRRNKKIFKWIGLLIFVLTILYVFVFKSLLFGYKYGKSANRIREQVKIPIIDPEMKKTADIGRFAGAKWEGKKKGKELSHLFKIVSYSINNYILNEESDMFRLAISDSAYWQLNMRSTVIGDSFSLRIGTLRLYDKILVKEIDLDDSKLDSLFRSWNLDHLVKN